MTHPPIQPSLTDAAGEAAKLARDAHEFAVWAKHEDIAMHFNDLSMRLRLQALGGVGAASLIAGTIFSKEGHLDLKLFGLFLAAMAVVWFAIFLLDFFYYQALLKGAVVAIREIEAASSALRLSTHVESKVGSGGRVARVMFYILVFTMLAAGAFVSLRQPTPSVQTPAVQTPTTATSAH